MGAQPFGDVAYERGGSGVGAVIFDNSGIDVLEAMRNNMLFDMQQQQRIQSQQQQHLNRLAQIVKDFDFDTTGVYDYDLPYFRDKAKEINDKAAALLQQYAGQSDKTNEFLERWHREVLGSYNDLKMLMEESKSDKEALKTVLNRYASNPGKYKENIDAMIAQANLIPVGARDKEGLSRKQLFAKALEPSFNENDYIANWVKNIKLHQTAQEVKKPDGSVQAVIKKELPAKDLYLNAQQLYHASDDFRESVDREIEALQSSQDEAERQLAKDYAEQADKLSRSMGVPITPADVFIAEKKIMPLVGDEVNIKGLLGRPPQRTASAAEISEQNKLENAYEFYKRYKNFVHGSKEELANIVGEGEVLTNPDGSYSAPFARNFLAGGATHYMNGLKILDPNKNFILDIKRMPDGLIMIKTTATALRHDMAKKRKIEGDFTREKYEENLRNNPEYVPIEENHLVAMFNANMKTLGGLEGFRYAKERYERERSKIENYYEQPKREVGKLKREPSGRYTYVRAKDEQGSRTGTQSVQDSFDSYLQSFEQHLFNKYVQQYEKQKDVKATEQEVQQLRQLWEKNKHKYITKDMIKQLRQKWQQKQTQYGTK